jgi:hypothetical protein
MSCAVPRGTVARECSNPRAGYPYPWSSSIRVDDIPFQSAITIECVLKGGV